MLAVTESSLRGIPDGKTSIISTQDVIKNSTSDDFILLNKREDRQDGCNAKCLNICVMTRSLY